MKNLKERTADGQAYAQGVKRATGFVSAFKYMKEHTQHTLHLLRTRARLGCALFENGVHINPNLYKATQANKNTQRALDPLDSEVREGCAFEFAGAY